MDERGDGAPRRVRLLFVCTGNICRSPFARFHTRALLEMRLGPQWASWFDVASGGTGAVVGAEMHPLSRAQLGPLATHPDVAAFRARQLPARDVEMADLVLTASRAHRSAVLELEPRALRRTFTMREFTRLLTALDPTDHAALPADPRDRTHALVAAALAQRGQGTPVDPEDDAIPDPVAGTSAEHAEAARRIHAAVRPLVDAIGAAVPWPARSGPPPRPGPPGRPGAAGRASALGPPRPPHGAGPVPPPHPMSPVGPPGARPPGAPPPGPPRGRPPVPPGPSVFPPPPAASPPPPAAPVGDPPGHRREPRLGPTSPAALVSPRAGPDEATGRESGRVVDAPGEGREAPTLPEGRGRWTRRAVHPGPTEHAHPARHEHGRDERHPVEQDRPPAREHSTSRAGR